MACCDECEKTGGNCAPKTTALGVPSTKLPPRRPEESSGGGDPSGGGGGSSGGGSGSSAGSDPDPPPHFRPTPDYLMGLGDDTAVAATPTPWGSIAVGFLAGGLTVLALKHFGVIRINPAHEDFVGRRVELHPGRGTVSRVEGDTLIVRTKHKLVRVRKDRVTLI